MSIFLLAALAVSFGGLIFVSSQTIKRFAWFNLFHISITDGVLNGKPYTARVRMVYQLTKYLMNQLLHTVIYPIILSESFALLLLIVALWRASVTSWTIDIEHILIVLAVSYALIRLLYEPIWESIKWPELRQRPGHSIYYSGLLGGEIPEKLYEGDSAQIILQFPWKAPFANRESNFGSYGFFSNETDLKYPALEVELQSAGFVMAGEKIQRLTLVSLPAIFSWNIFASSSGNFEIGIVIRFYRSDSDPPLVSSFRSKLRVVKVLGLNKRQLWLITGVFGAITGFFGVIQTLIKLKIVSLP